MDDLEKSVLSKMKENYSRTKNNHDDIIRVENLVQESGNIMTQVKKELVDIGLFKAAVASQIRIDKYLPFTSDEAIVEFFTRQSGETKADVHRRKLGLENYMRVRQDLCWKHSLLC
jgi:hypothetical protein